MKEELGTKPGFSSRDREKKDIKLHFGHVMFDVSRSVIYECRGQQEVKAKNSNSGE